MTWNATCHGTPTPGASQVSSQRREAYSVGYDAPEDFLICMRVG
jgi:hypothetical protein